MTAYVVVVDKAAFFVQNPPLVQKIVGPAVFMAPVAPKPPAQIIMNRAIVMPTPTPKP